MVKDFFVKRKLNIIFSLVALAVMWIAWVIIYYGVGNPLIAPSFSQTVASFWRYLSDGEFWLAVLNSLWRTAAAFLFSFVTATACAALAALFKWAKPFFACVISVLRTLPTLAVILLILKMTYGNRSLSPVIVTVLVLFPMIYSQMLAAAEGIDGGLVQMAKLYKISQKDRLFKIYMPLVCPTAVSQTGANISLGLKVMISAEVLVSTAKGLGGMMQQNNVSGEIANLAALTLTAVLLGLAIEFAFAQLSRVFRKWNAAEAGND